jgi:hypothetical protein
MNRCIGAIVLIWSSSALAQSAATPCVASSPQRITPRLPGGQPFYVEPNAIGLSGGTLVIAGAPSYVWATSGFDSSARFQSVFGAFIHADGRSTAIPSPFPKSRIAEIRIAPLGTKDFAAVFAETEPQRSPVRPPNVIAYWYGTFAETKWSNLERLPIAATGLRVGAASRLVSRGEELAIAVPVDSQSRSYVAVLVRQNGSWKLHRIMKDEVAYLAVGIPSPNRILVGVVTPDATQTKDANSLFLYSSINSGNDWNEPTKLASGGEHPIHHPEFQLEAVTPAAAWISENPSNAVAMIWEDPGGIRSQTLRLSDAAVQVVYVPSGANLIWVMQEIRGKWPGKLKVVQYGGDRLSTLLTMPNPFAADYAATTLDETLFIVGPVASFSPGTPPVTLKLIAIKLSCPANK